jgi:hypothetical protein
METLVGILVLAAPIAIVAALFARLDRRERRHGLEIQRQIALTDAIHARLGAVAAPVVRRGRNGWRIGVTVPFERPAVVDAVLASVHQEFGRAADYTVLLSRQTPPTPSAKASRAVARGKESLSWT